MRQNRFRTDYELEVMVWNVDSSATEAKLQEVGRMGRPARDVLSNTPVPFS